MDKELKDLLEEQNKAFDEFKKSNDELLKAKAEGKAVSELEAKVGSAEAEIARLSKELDEVAKKANRPGAAGTDEKAHIEAEHKAGWLKWIRKGDDAGLSGLEAKAISVGTQADGGYAVPVEQDREILRLLREQSPMRQVCRVVTIGTEDFRKLDNLGGTASGWVGEKAARSETATAKFAELKPVFGEIYANPAVTQKALDDLAARGIGMIHTVMASWRTRTCRMSAPTPPRFCSATMPAPTGFSIVSAFAACAIRLPTSPTSISTPRSGWAACWWIPRL